jgi:hypothetical protein
MFPPISLTTSRARPNPSNEEYKDVLTYILDLIYEEREGSQQQPFLCLAARDY